MRVLHLGRTGLTMPMPTILIQHGSRCEDHRGISYGELFRKCPEGKFWQVLASFVSSIRVATCQRKFRLRNFRYTNDISVKLSQVE